MVVEGDKMGSLAGLKTGFRVFVSAIAVSQLVGCASIVTGQNQSISVETRTDGGPVTGANCKLTNDKGTWYVASPGSAVVQRSYQDLDVRCEKESYDPGIASVKSSTKAMAAGNILFGGAIGIGVDIATGAAYDYPPLVTVLMGPSRTVGAPPSSAASAPPTDGTQQVATAAPAATASVAAPSASREAAAIANPVESALGAQAGKSAPAPPGSKSGVTGLRVLLRDTDPWTRMTLAESILTIDSNSERGTTINSGTTTLDSTGRLLTGAVPLPHVAGLGGGRLRPGMIVTASLIPMTPSPPVEVRISALRMETLVLSDREITLVRCSVTGWASHAEFPGETLGEKGATISGEIAVEPSTGLVLSAKVQSRHRHYGFVRSAWPAAR